MTMTRWALAAALLAAAPAVADDAVEARLRKDLGYLASPECAGRAPGTPGIEKAADYIAAEFARAGLKNAAGLPDAFQPFTIRGGARLGSPNSVVLRGPGGKTLTLEAGKDFAVLGLADTGKVSAGVVFAGYGITTDGYDDYKGVDVAGKVVVVLRQTPRAGNKDKPFPNANEVAPFTAKLTNAGLHKAAAVLFVSDADKAGEADDLVDFNMVAQGEAPTTRLPAAHVKRRVVEELLGQPLKQVEALIDADAKPQSRVLDGWTADVETTVNRTRTATKNVVGVLDGAGPAANETVVVGAHYDHLGEGGLMSGSLAPREKKTHFGADDNASGTTALIELARRFAAQKDRQGRRLVFIAFSGEERGLLGSKHYVEHPLYPLDSTVAMVNLDMVGRLKDDKLQVGGTGTAKTFDGLVEKLNAKYKFALEKSPGGMGPSDHASFYPKKVPVFFFFTGIHPDYHKPTDTPDKVNYAGMRKIIDLTEELAGMIAAGTDRPEYVAVKGGLSPRSQGDGPPVPRLGFMPGNYEEEEKGVLIGGVTPGGPADKGGLKAGDFIVEVAGKPVKNMTAYMAAMRQQKRGEPVELGVLRGGKRETIKVTPQ